MLRIDSKILGATWFAAAFLAGFVAYGEAGFSFLKFFLVCAAFALGLFASSYSREKPPQIKDFLDSDWRHFEALIEMTPEQLAKLQSLTRRAALKPDALAWLQSQPTLDPNAAEALLKFFVASGWASGGDAAHANDPEWRWEV